MPDVVHPKFESCSGQLVQEFWYLRRERRGCFVIPSFRYHEKLHTCALQCETVDLKEGFLFWDVKTEAFLLKIG